MTDDLSPQLGGDKPTLTGREPGLPRLYQQRYKEMTFEELFFFMDNELRHALVNDCADRVRPYINHPDDNVRGAAQYVIKCAKENKRPVFVFARSVFGFLEVFKAGGWEWETGLDLHTLGCEKMRAWQKARAIEYLTGKVK